MRRIGTRALADEIHRIRLIWFDYLVYWRMLDFPRQSEIVRELDREVVAKT